MFKNKSKFIKSEKLYLPRNHKLRGQVSIPGDKSISQRALIIGLISNGVTKIENILESEDVFHTLQAIILLGGKVDFKNNTIYINGSGLGNIISPDKPIYMGNSGTGTRLLLGLVAGSDATVTFYGDNSLNKRPMSRVIIPLEKMGAKFIFAKPGRLPLTVIGARKKGITIPINYKIPVVSAQVKSAIIFASLTARGKSKIVEKNRSRNNTEKMLSECGVEIRTKTQKNKSIVIELEGVSYIKSKKVKVPGDPSTAAFLVVAALITKDSKVTLENIYYDRFRLKVFDVLKKMGAKIKIIKNENKKTCNIRVISSALNNLTIPSNLASYLIDEYPILSIAAACGSGIMTMKGLEELRYKESDRLIAIFQGLKSSGVKTSIKKNTLIIEGMKQIVGGNIILAKDDHRIAMAFNILSLVTKKPIFVEGNNSIRTSFPLFFDCLQDLGVKIKKR